MTSTFAKPTLLSHLSRRASCRSSSALGPYPVPASLASRSSCPAPAPARAHCGGECGPRCPAPPRRYKKKVQLLHLWIAPRMGALRARLASRPPGRACLPSALPLDDMQNILHGGGGEGVAKPRSREQDLVRRLVWAAACSQRAVHGADAETGQERAQPGRRAASPARPAPPGARHPPPRLSRVA